MSAVAKVALLIMQGATFRHKFTWQGADKRSRNLTGYTAKMQIRATAAATAVLQELSSVNGKISLGGNLGTIDLHLTALETASYSWSTAVYDLELIAPSGDVYRLVEGGVTVSPEVTR